VGSFQFFPGYDGGMRAVLYGVCFGAVAFLAIGLLVPASLYPFTPKGELSHLFNVSWAVCLIAAAAGAWIGWNRRKKPPDA
jgi:hypothetical protein